jgi:hypothetical protein
MSPTVFYHKGRRYFFFSREETRRHIHVVSEKGEAKFWFQPIVSLADYTGFSVRELTEIERTIHEHRDEIEKAWKRHFQH